MEMKLAAPASHLPVTVDHMNQVSSQCSTPYMSAASSPRRQRPHLDFFFYSAPTSPRSSAAASYFHDQSLFDDVYEGHHADYDSLLKHELPIGDFASGSSYTSSAAVPFDWEIKPGIAKSPSLRPNRVKDDHQQNQEKIQEKDDFEFEFSGQLDMMVRPSLSSADELFDGGKIRPQKLKPPPSLIINHDSRINSGNQSPKSPKSAMSKFKDALSVSPRHRRRGMEFGADQVRDQDPFEAALRSTTAYDDDNESQHRDRGRGRAKPKTLTNTSMNNRGSNSGRKGISRSLSPLRVSEFALLDHQQLQEHQSSNETSISSRFLLGGTSTGSKKWRLKDLFLFRSASEGHNKDTQSFSKRWSFRTSATGSSSGSVSGSVSESGSVSKRRGQGASAHEMHYTTNRAASEEMRKRSNLPYKHGLLACLGFSPILPQFSYAFPSSASSLS